MWTEKNAYRHALIAPTPTFKVFEEQPYFCYHSNAPLSPSLFHSCFFFSPLKKIHHSLPLSLVNITETPRLALHLLAQRGEGGRGTAHISEGVVKKPGWGQYQEVPDSQDGGLKRDRRPSSQKCGGLEGVS